MSGRTYPNIRVLRDVQRREAVQSTELLRRSFLYLARNESLPQRVRHQAQLALASRSIFSNKTRPVSVKERCTETGRGRGVLSKGLPYGLCRHQFKLQATRGELPGWAKGSW
ncbi:MAG: 40S ribosomal protein mrp2, mitochondrial [Cyphobasidiales sp. Tagirdzhanova-0007]|nr:MAG: 40S ribosomal protein mrp2, mitochondrial [Cyphobasidiales sp. Tagirdzhanova-0007]